jgi:dCMP deaminase
MNMGIVLSGLSYARRSKVGCLIVSQDGQIISQGYNGMPSGMDNNCEYEDENGDLHTRDEVLHAEANAIAKCAKWHASTNNATLYVTLSPCINCAKQMIQCGIKRVVYNEEYRDLSGIRLLLKVGIEVERLAQMGDKIALIKVDEKYLNIQEHGEPD